MLDLLEPILSQPDLVTTEIASWANLWLARLQRTHTEVDTASAPLPELQRANRIVERLRSLAGGEMREASPKPFDLIGGKTPANAAAAGGSGGVVWLAGLLTWMGIVAAGYRGSRSPWLQELARRWTSGCAVLVALAIAILVSPWLGGVLMLISAAASLTWPWRRPAGSI
jgi:hypothetical protein